MKWGSMILETGRSELRWWEEYAEFDTKNISKRKLLSEFRKRISDHQMNTALLTSSLKRGNNSFHAISIFHHSTLLTALNMSVVIKNHDLDTYLITWKTIYNMSQNEK